MASNTSGVMRAVILVLTLMLGACATHTWAPGPDAKGTYEEASAQCSLMARHSGGGFYASGTERQVAAATLGYALGEAIRTQTDFNDCMSASGWVVADQDSAALAQMQAQKAQAQQIGDQFKTCVSAARSNPKYAALLPHLKDLSLNRYTLVQMADNQLPSVQEAALLAAYGDQEQACRDEAASQVASIDPRAGQALKSLEATERNLDLELVSRQITWGQYARSAQNVIDTAEGHPSAPPPGDSSYSAESGSAEAQTPGLPSASNTGQPACTHEQLVQARIAKENGYTGGPHCS